jgi:ABC-2 type transport system permease protein
VTRHGMRRAIRVFALGWLFHFKMLSQSAFDGFLAVLWPLFFATTTYFMFRAGQNTTSLASVALGSAVMGVWTATSVSASSALQRERRQGTLELLVTAPTSLAAILLAIAIATATIGLYCIVATLLWARLLFGIHVPIADPGLFAGGIALTVLTIGSLGFLMAVLFVRSRRAWALGAVSEYPIWILCGFLIPLSLLPHWVHPVAWALGPTWGMRAIRHGALGGSARGDTGLRDAGVCLALTGVYVAAGVLLLDRMLDAARRQATLSLT